MQDIPQETLSETTKAEQSAKVDLWEFDLTAIGGERFFFCNEPNEKGEPLDILINGYLIAQGEVVVVADKYGVRITDIITPSERMRRLSR